MGEHALRPAVFLDRDGVLNRAYPDGRSTRPPRSLDELEILPGVAEALQRLQTAGYALVGVSNQPDLARGLASAAAVAELNAALLARLPGLVDILVCPHDDADGCACRKPKPGLLLDAARRFGLDLSRSVLVGDRWSDVEAGRAAGCRTVLIAGPFSGRERCQPDLVARDLAQAAELLLAGPGLTRPRGLHTVPLSHSGTGPEGMTDAAPSLERLKVRIFADGADLPGLLEMAARPYVSGFTTNPTLMRKAGVADYRAFAREALRAVSDRPISFEVFADEPAEMERQAREIASWGGNVFVKVPVTTTRGQSCAALVRRLAHDGLQLNVTALLTLEQVREVSQALGDGAPAFVSVFAGRVADTGRDPVPHMAEALRIMAPFPRQQLIWASPRELLNVFQADAIGCHVITVTNDVLKKLPLVGKDLGAYSLETVRMFFDDGQAAGYRL